MRPSQPSLDSLPAPAASEPPAVEAPGTDRLTLFRALKVRDFALDRIRQGLSVYDGQQRLLLFNRRYAEMYNLKLSQLRIGMSLRDVVELRCAAGTGPLMPAEEYTQWRGRIGIAGQVLDTEVTLSNGHAGPRRGRRAAQAGGGADRRLPAPRGPAGAAVQRRVRGAA